MYTFADKPKAAKARLVILGHRQKIKPTAVEKFAATPGMTSFRVMCAVATQHDDEIDHMDISQAFTQADAFRDDVHIYVNPPEFSNTPPNMVWRLIRPLYGLAIAPAAWSATMQNFLLTDNWTQVTGEECMYTKPTQSGYRLLLTCYVDDILISYHRNDGAEAAAFKARLMTRFSARDEGPVTRYLGLDVTRDRIQRTLTLSQEQYTLDVLERHGMSPATVNACETPLSLSAHLTRADSPTTPDSALGTKYRDAVGCIQWLAGATRPDLAFAAQYLARFSSNPGAAHWREVKHCLRYLCGTADLSLQFSSSNPNHLLTDQLYGFCDSDWGSDTDTRRSVGAYVLFLNGSPLSWRSKMQPTIALSTAEAEFMAASNTCNEVVWLRRILAAISLPQRGPTPLYEDNQACIMISEHPSYKGRAKHIDMRVHALREHVANRIVTLTRCPTHDMTADALTKQLPGPTYKRHRGVLLGHTQHTAPDIRAFFAWVRTQ